MQEESAGIYDYGFWRRNAFLWWLALVLLLGASLGLEVGPPEKIRTWSYWIGNMALTILVFGTPLLVMHRRRLRSCRPIAIRKHGVVFAPGSTHQQTIAWMDLEQVESLSPAQIGRKISNFIGYYGGVFSGLRLVAGDREIPILRSIRRYKELRRQLEARCREHGIPFDAPE